MTDTEITLLEAYLDDALSPTEVQRLDARLSGEPEIAAALDSLRNDRAARVAAFASLTPDQPAADRSSDGVVKHVHRRELFRRFIGGARIAASLAACVAIGIGIGWVVRGHQEKPQVVIATPGPAQPLLIHQDIKQATTQIPSVTPLTVNIERLGLIVTSLAKDDPYRVLYPQLQTRPAIRIDAVAPNSAADKAGIHAGDVILMLAGANVGDAPSLAALLAQANGKIDVQIMADNVMRDVTINFPDKAGRGIVSKS